MTYVILATDLKKGTGPALGGWVPTAGGRGQARTRRAKGAAGDGRPTSSE